MQNINKTKIEKTDAEGKPLGNAGPQTLWVRKEVWEKLLILKKDIGGNWSRLMEVVCEQIMASGIVSSEAREKIREITRRSGTELVDDSDWRKSFQIGEPWPEVAATQKQMAEELVKINVSINQLVEAVEDHGTAMLSIEHLQPDELEDEE